MVSAAVLVAKAKQPVSEYNDIQAIQDALAAGLFLEWSESATGAIAGAVAALEKAATVGAGAVEDAHKALLKGMKGWPSKSMKKAVGSGVDQMYRLAATAIFKKHLGLKGYNTMLVFKAAAEASFDVVDQQAIEYLSNGQLFWLREHFDSDVLDSIQAGAYDDLEGLPGAEAAATLKARAERIFGVGAFSDMGAAYFQGVAVNAATTARVTGSILELHKVGVDSYIIVNPMDERTTAICKDMNGKTFPVDGAASRIKDIVKADNPADIKALHPWAPGNYTEVFNDLGVTVTAGKDIDVSAAEVLQKAGYGMPPFHFRCRTTVDIG